MGGLGKRRADFVPEKHRVSLDHLSKADLMEVAYSLAMRLEADDSEAAFNLVANEHRTLCASAGRKPQRL
jgi:hypothetical protein